MGLARYVIKLDILKPKFWDYFEQVFSFPKFIINIYLTYSFFVIVSFIISIFVVARTLRHLKSVLTTKLSENLFVVNTFNC